MTNNADVRTEGAADFNATSVTFKAETPKAREFFAQRFGIGAISFDTPKSNCGSVVLALATYGLKVVVR